MYTQEGITMTQSREFKVYSRICMNNQNNPGCVRSIHRDGRSSSVENRRIEGSFISMEINLNEPFVQNGHNCFVVLPFTRRYGFLYSQSGRTGTGMSLLTGKITELLCLHSLLRGENELSLGFHSREAGLPQSFSDLSRTSHICCLWGSVDPFGNGSCFFFAMVSSLSSDVTPV